MRTKRSWALIALAAAGVVALTGCGAAAQAPTAGSSPAPASSASTPAGSSPATSVSASPSADSSDALAEIKASITLARQAKTFRVVADGEQAGKPLKLDLHYGSNGVDGSVLTEGTEFDIKDTGDLFYFRAPAAFWRQQGGAQGDTLAERFGDKWVKTRSDSAIGKGFNAFSDAEKFLAQFTQGFDASGGMSGAKQVGTSSVDGQPTKTYTDDSNEGTIDIAANSQPYPLKIELTPKASTGIKGTITLSDWNKAFTVEPPSESVSLPT